MKIVLISNLDGAECCEFLQDELSRVRRMQSCVVTEKSELTDDRPNDKSSVAIQKFSCSECTSSL